MEKLWFKSKQYGYGWYPATWEGWLVMLGFIGLLLLPIGIFTALNPEYLNTPAFAFNFVLYAVILAGFLLWICFKTGEKLRWRWGGK